MESISGRYTGKSEKKSFEVHVNKKSVLDMSDDEFSQYLADYSNNPNSLAEDKITIIKQRLAQFIITSVPILLGVAVFLHKLSQI